MAINWLGTLVLEQVNCTDSILDIGCGIMQPTGGPIGSRHFGVDIFDQYLNHIRKDTPTIRGSAPEIFKAFVDKSWDWVLLLDVIEHMEKDAGRLSIREAERVARKGVLICTPKGYIRQDAWEAWGMRLNPYQEHLCGFEPEELNRMGYTTIEIRKSTEQHGEAVQTFAKKIFEMEL